VWFKDYGQEPDFLRPLLWARSVACDGRLLVATQVKKDCESKNKSHKNVADENGTHQTLKWSGASACYLPLAPPKIGRPSRINPLEWEAKALKVSNAVANHKPKHPQPTW